MNPVILTVFDLTSANLILLNLRYSNSVRCTVEPIYEQMYRLGCKTARVDPTYPRTWLFCMVTYHELAVCQGPGVKRRLPVSPGWF
jgi:hypothetical protein